MKRDDNFDVLNSKASAALALSVVAFAVAVTTILATILLSDSVHSAKLDQIVDATDSRSQVDVLRYKFAVLSAESATLKERVADLADASGKVYVPSTVVPAHYTDKSTAADFSVTSAESLYTLTNGVTFVSAGASNE